MLSVVHSRIYLYLDQKRSIIRFISVGLLYLFCSVFPTQRFRFSTRINRKLFSFRVYLEICSKTKTMQRPSLQNKYKINMCQCHLSIAKCLLFFVCHVSCLNGMKLGISIFFFVFISFPNLTGKNIRLIGLKIIVYNEL